MAKKGWGSNSGPGSRANPPTALDSGKKCQMPNNPMTLREVTEMANDKVPLCESPFCAGWSLGGSTIPT